MSQVKEVEAKANHALAAAETGVSASVNKPIKLVLMDKDAIKADQDGIRKTVLSLDMNVHGNAVQCLMHAEKHGDTSLMTRLLVDILDERTGYNRRGLIRWMREFSPMELNGKKITLTGVDDAGNRRPFRVEQANNTPFYSSEALNQQSVKPVFQDTLLSKFDTMVKEFQTSWENTVVVNGVPSAIDNKKPFYNGTNSAQILDFIQKGKAMRDEINSDDSREIYLAKQRLAKDAEVAGLKVA